MENRPHLSVRRLTELLEARDLEGAQALLRTGLTGRACEVQDDVLFAFFASPPPVNGFVPVAEALQGLVPDADGFSALAERLEANGAVLAAQAAQKGAAKLDFEAQPAMDVWGGAFNGQTFRKGLFDQLVKQLRIAAIVETGTFRGTTTAYMAKLGLPVFSCELHPRYFHYSSLRLAGAENIQLALADSRRFLGELLDGNLLPSGPVFFYLDAHWEQDLPLWGEIELLISRHPAPVIMVDDFRVPADSGFKYDDYGKGKCLSVSCLREEVTARPSLFFPDYAAADESGARRGCVVLAQGDIAQSIAREVPMLAQLTWTDALVLDGISELRNYVTGREREEQMEAPTKSEAQLATTHAEQILEELKQMCADSEARWTAMRAEQTSLALRVHELSNAAVSAEHAQRQRELEAESARRDAKSALEEAAGLRSIVRYLHEELGALEASAAERNAHEVLEAARAATLQRDAEAARAAVAELQSAARYLRGELETAKAATTELQRSRWRRIGQRLGIARKASFER
jgi:predicted O-methyltransferase YrrM